MGLVDPQLTDQVVGLPNQDYAYALPPFTWLRGWGKGGLGSVTVLYRLRKVLCNPYRIDEIGLRFLLFRIVGVSL